MSNQLDDFFKNKLQERSFDYDESAWEDARLLIEADERGKKSRYLFFLFAGLSMLMLVGSSAYYLGKQSSAPTPAPIHNNTPQQTNNLDEKKIIAKSDYENSKTIINKDATATKESRTASYDNDLALSSASVDVVARSLATVGSNNNNNNTKTGVDNNKKKNSFNDDNAQGVASTTTTTVYNSTTIVTNPNTVTKAAPRLSENKNAASTIDIQSDVAQLPLLNPQYVMESNELLVELPAFQKDVEGIPITDSSNKFFFGIRGGLALVPQEFMDFEAGVELGYQINRNWSVAFQPKYQYQTLAQNTLDESEVNEFGFGLRASAFILEAETIRSIHIPLMLSYSFGKQALDLTDKVSSRYLKNKVSIGAAYVVTDGITGTIFQSEAAGESSVFQSGYLSKNSFNRHNAELMIGYDRYLSQRFSLGLQARYRVRDQFTDLFTNQNQDIAAPNTFYLGLQANFKIF